MSDQLLVYTFFVTPVLTERSCIDAMRYMEMQRGQVTSDVHTKAIGT